jgi:hypothetical protein
MIRALFTLILVAIQFVSFSNVTIRGMAYSYAGQTLAIYQIDDFISNHETLIKETEINSKGYFILSLEVPEIKKYIIRVKNAFASLYLQDKARYTIEFPEDINQRVQISNSKEVEITLIDLDSTDINYKILGFEAWMDSYISDIYYTRESDHGNFIRKIRSFKDEVERYYSKDTSSYFRDFLKYSIGQNIENLQFIGAPSAQDKFDFYFNEQAILYLNDAYMTYFNGFYKKYLFQLSGTKANELYVSIARGDLYLTDSILSTDLYLKNNQLRQLVLLNILKEEYYSNYLPKSGILKLLTKINTTTTIDLHALIAKNLLTNFNTAAVGFRFPELLLQQKGDSIQLSSLKGKYIYLHAFDPKNPTCNTDVGALKKLYEKYGKEIEFITIYPVPDIAYTKIEQRNLDALNWKKSSYTIADPIWAKLQIFSFPCYLLIDDSFYLVASPALSPIPNGNYQTIEKTFYDIIHQNDKE